MNDWSQSFEDLSDDRDLWRRRANALAEVLELLIQFQFLCTTGRRAAEKALIEVGYRE